MKVRTLNGSHKYQWTQFELLFMRANYMKLTNEKLSFMLGHRKTLVRTKCYDMGLKRMEMEYWTDEQILFLRDNYKDYGDSELAEIYDVKWHKDKGWSKKHIEKKRRYLDFKRTAKEKFTIYERNKKMGRWALCPVHRWETTGATPIGNRKIWNGQDGRQFVVIKLKTGFVHYAPWLYEQIYGPVPEGFVVRTKDDNPLNVKPGNLDLITRAEHAARNSKNRMPKELRELKILSNKLTSVINEAANRKKAPEHAQ